MTVSKHNPYIWQFALRPYLLSGAFSRHGHPEFMNQKTTELKKNELADIVEKKFGDLRPYSGTILLGLLALILVGIVGAYWNSLRAVAKSQPWQDLQFAMASHQNDRQTSHFDVVSERHSDSLASLWALQLSGDADLRMGLAKLITEREASLKQIERARRALEKIQESTLKRPELLTERSLYSLAYAYESLGEFEKAKSAYSRMMKEMPDAPMTIMAKEGLARLDNPAFVAAFDKFKSVGTAPDMVLPPMPDISFPDSKDAPAGNASTSEPNADG